MIEPVQLDDFFITFFASAGVILAGALYALLFAFSRLYHKPRLLPLAYGAYAVLALCVLTISQTLHLNGYWSTLVGVMLIGYLLAPHGIWRLSVETYAGEHH